MPNRLIGATSPYLLQHAHNPVDWYPWGEEALARARAEDKPILLSIGYSACHWCHVMERESFEDEATAALMNEHFVPVKVDREERPDIDDIYMAATLAMNQGQGGWPMTVFVTPDQEPFFAGTYFPPEDRYGRPGFKTVLTRIADLWARDRVGLKAQAAEVVRYLQEGSRPAPGAAVGEAELRTALTQFEREFDERWGGFGHAPKFPPATGLGLLLRCHRRFADPDALAMVRVTLDRMARGGMYDQVAGGFSRYSVDERWLVPHFEKMLYDNALLARAYLEGYQATGDTFHQRIATEILDYVLREMAAPEGGFYSATDADSEGEEGKFFVWTPGEIREAVGEPEQARRFCAYYDITERGNFEGRSIPNTPRPLPEVAAELGLVPAELEASLATARAAVYKARLQRVPPALDDKVLTAWNGLMIGALAEGHRVLGDPRYGEAARRAADFVLATLRDDRGRLLRTYRAGTAHLAAYLEDYAYLAEGLLDLYEAGAPRLYLDEAARLARHIVDDYAAEGGGFYSTARDHESLVVRHREGHDGATPAANGTAAHVLARLSFHLDRPELREQALLAVRAYGKAIQRHPRAFAKTLCAVDLLLGGPLELGLVGPLGDAGLEALRREVGRHYVPNRIVAHHDPAEGGSTLPLLAGKTLVGGRAALYVCRDFACRRPVTEADEVAEALAAPPAPAAPSPRSLGSRLPGSASPDGTAAAAGRGHRQATGYTTLGSTGLQVSRVGFGGYRVDDETAAHRDAMALALRSGVDVLDTSTNYTDGGSERLFGELLGELVRAGDVRREGAVVVSKIGYVQGRNLELAREREAAGRPFPDMVKYGEGIWHCIHPEFLADQLDQSLDRLQLETLDVCLLHNPEYYLSDAHERSHGTLDRRREEFYRRLRDAFAWLETQVAAGRIRAYGVSSNTCTRPADDPEATSLTRMLEVAGAGFRVLQLPMNLLEPAAALERNSGPGRSQTVLEAAQAAGVGVLVNRPLNAMAGDGMVRLADVPVEAAAVDLREQTRVVAELEEEYRREIASHLQAAEGSVPPDEFFRWGTELDGVEAQIGGREHWEALQAQRIAPRLMRSLQALDQALTGPLAEDWQGWRARYVPEMQKVLRELGRQASGRSRRRLDRIREVLDPLLPADRRGESLSRKALWVVASVQGVSSVLVGMRSPEYVKDALAVLDWPPLPRGEEVLRALSGVVVEPAGA
jgi:uncharacterized protein